MAGKTLVFAASFQDGLRKAAMESLRRNEFAIITNPSHLRGRWVEPEQVSYFTDLFMDNPHALELIQMLDVIEAMARPT